MAGRLGGRLRTAGGDALEEVRGGATGAPSRARGAPAPARAVDRPVAPAYGESANVREGRMPTGTSSLRKTKRRGAALVAACAAALVAALAGPAWAGSVPTARRSTGRAARPGIAADRGGADEGVVARAPDDAGRRNRGVDSDARRTPGGADDARDAEGGCTARPPPRRKSRGHDAGADEHRDPAARADVRLYGHREHREARACRRLCAARRPRRSRNGIARNRRAQRRRRLRRRRRLSRCRGTATASACRSGR